MKSYVALVPLAFAAISVAEAHVSSATDSAGRTGSIEPSLRIAQVFYRVDVPANSLTRSVDETLLNAVVDGALHFEGSSWSLGSQVSASVAPLIRSTPVIGFLDARVFGRYAAWSGGGWSLAVQLGGSYATTYGASELGYSHLVGPMAGVSLRKVTALGDISSIYTRAELFPSHFGDGHLDVGFSYLFSQGGTDRGFEFLAEVGYLTANFDMPGTRSTTGIASSVIASLGVGYRF